MTTPCPVGLVRRGLPLAALAVLLPAVAGAQAQSLTGSWGSSLYQVQLTVNGSQLTGSFTALATPGGAPGTITGQVQANGQSCAAQWTFPASGETASFSTWLQLTARGRVLSGYRWSDDAPPAAFALHRASNGQVPVLPDESSVGAPPANLPKTPPATPTPPAQPARPAPAAPTTGAPSLEVSVCEAVTDGQPRNVNTEFTAPKTLLGLVHYTNLPANSAVGWSWTREGQTQASTTKALSGSGWHYHGLQSATALTPGSYRLTLTLNGTVAAQRTVTVRGPALAPVSAPAAPISQPPATAWPTPPAPKLTLIACQEVVAGEPRGAGTVFVRPRSLVGLFSYQDLLPGSQVKFIWKRGGQELSRHLTYVGGTGRSWYGVTNPKGLPAGSYDIAVYVRGSAGPTLRVTVR